MSIRILRKAMGLLLVDIIVIIGIFVLQFRTDSNIIEKIGNLQVTLSKKENINVTDENNTLDVEVSQLGNRFSVLYNGINIYSDEDNPIFIVDNNAEVCNLVLKSWEKIDDLSCAFHFYDDVNITFELASEDSDASLAIITDFPESYNNIFIPYNFSSNMVVEKESKGSIVFDRRKDLWEISADNVLDGSIEILNSNSVATYSVYEEIKEFSFDSISSLPIANMAIFREKMEMFSNNLIAAFNANTNNSLITEQIAVSYIAAMGAKGKYNEAIDNIPYSLKKGNSLTYLSTPYFNSLEKKNDMLDKSIEIYENKISESAASGSLDIFTIHNIANYMSVHSNPSVIKTLMENTAKMTVPEELSLAQAAGIIQVFVDLSYLRPDYAELLYPIVGSCIDRISKACNYDGTNLTISENGTFLSVIQAIETGVAVMRYGLTMEDDIIKKAGCVIVNSYLSEAASFDLRTLANLYPLLAFDNTFYPHFKKVDFENGNMVWAWTCARDIRYEKESDGSINIIMDFPEGATHHVIFKGVPKFKRIYIYGLSYRSDSRFETYNTSGYVYKDKLNSLLLKSKHKERYETVRLEYDSTSNIFQEERYR